MATLKITNKTLEVMTEGDESHWLVRMLKSAWTGKKSEAPGRDLLQLSMFRRVRLDRGETPLTVAGLVKNGYSSKYFWAITLHDLHGNSTPVIASRDEGVMVEAYTQINTALNTDKPFHASVNIENSTVVVGSYIGRDAKTDVRSNEDSKANGKPNS